MIRKNRITLLTVIFLSVFILGATPFNKSGRNNNDMSKRVEQLEKQNVELRKQIEDLTLKVELLTRKVNGQGHASNTSGRGNPMSSHPGLSVKKLTPESQRMSNAPKGRLIVTGSNNNAKNIVESGTPLPGTNYVPLPDPASKVKRPGSQTPKKIKSSPAPALATPKPVTSLGESGDFKKINTLMDNGSKVEAVELMDAYLLKHKGGAHENKVAYWKGKSLLDKGEHNQAIDYLKIVTERYPACNDASDALYSIGLSYLELGHSEEAGDALREVNILYPFSEAAGKAGKKLETCCQ
jgi:TolA-binding protein